MRSILCPPPINLGRAVLGYDCYTGEEPAYPALDRLAPAEWAALTREPRIYGFHATLKAPFRLLLTFDEAALMRAFASFAASRHSIPVIEPCVCTLGPFMAIMSPGRAPRSITWRHDASRNSIVSARR